MTNTAIGRLRLALIALFLVLGGRQLWLQLVAAPTIAARPGNPRNAMLGSLRGSIVAADGSILAASSEGRRIYPLGPAAAHLVGYASVRYGTSGLEAAYDRALSPPAASGDPVAQVQEIVHALEGKPLRQGGAEIVTTIVPAIQERLYHDLSAWPRAAGVVLDPRTGAVLAMASVPSFDPNRLDAVFPRLLDDPQSPLLNRAIDGLYPPGSTFKMVTASAALESGLYDLDSRFYDPTGYIRIGSVRLYNDDREATGTQTLVGAFALSVNVDFARIVLTIGKDEFYRYIRRFGIGAPLDFQLPAARARVPPPQDVTPGELAQMAFGQGALAVSPLQMALVAAAIANGGVEPRPYVVRAVVRPGGMTSTFGPSVLATPISADTAAEVTKLMVAVVQRGTGTPAQIPGVLVAGKTGTATNPFGPPHSWFVCFAPADAPRAVVAILVENAGYGASVAAPIARDVLQVALASGKR